ncbi:MAG TPA: glutamate synthase subunit beta [Acidothermaceae bacterium]|nr:glutamate synthase subunit beta [Acidothermaceae bacterium]
MADPRGFLKSSRETASRRPVDVRIMDWKEVYEPVDRDFTRTQASRCMDCGIPFCHNGCPLGNLIPEWNDLVRQGNWQDASERLHATNNFPDFTGRLCPAPCEAACVLAIDPAQTSGAVTIKMIEQEIADRAWDDGNITPQVPGRLTLKTVAVVGSGPAGLAAAQQLTRAGHTVAVYERADRIGGLLRYGIPEFKMEKWVIDRRLEQMKAEGTKFRPGVEIGVDMSARELKSRYDVVLLAIGSTVGRDLPIPGRHLDGIHQAMEYLPIANRVQQGDLAEPTITAKGKHVIIIGGGDTGADCLGTAHRQGAASVVQLEILPEPPAERAPITPWPTWPLMLRVSSAHEEGGERRFAVNTEEFLGDDAGRVRALRLVEVRMVDGRVEAVPGTEVEIPAELVLLAMGFTGPEKRLAEQFELDLDTRGNIARDASYATNVPGVFVAGDAGRGQSLIVWAIAEGRAAASAIDRYLTGVERLPMPVAPTARPLT